MNIDDIPSTVKLYDCSDDQFHIQLQANANASRINDSLPYLPACSSSFSHSATKNFMLSDNIVKSKCDNISVVNSSVYDNAFL